MQLNHLNNLIRIAVRAACIHSNNTETRKKKGKQRIEESNNENEIEIKEHEIIRIKEKMQCTEDDN